MSTIEDFYHSAVWANCRSAYRKSVGGVCERCAEQGIITVGDEVHHKRHLTAETVTVPEIATGFDNLVLLCKHCHDIEHGKHKTIADEFGHVKL